jgi:NosR/NirI family transcriptional regulator, nitrous oxide reductase regulator
VPLVRRTAPMRGWAIRWLIGLVAIACATACRAGVLTHDKLAETFPPPLVVGERHAALPVWPIFRPGPRGPELFAQVFETVDVEPVSGYGGKPLNLLVVIDPAGKFLEVQLLDHAEPIFMSKAGTATLSTFAKQYEGLSSNHNVQILSPKAQRSQTETTAVLHGVTAGTVSALAIDRSVMEAAAQVAQARLDAPGARRSAAAPRGPNDRYERTGWNALAKAGLVQNLAFTNREVEACFKGTPAAGRDAEGTLRPDGLAIDLWLALPGLPQAGRNLLDAAGWHQVRGLREDGTHVVLVFDNSRYPLADESSPRGIRSLGLALQQDDQWFALKELPYAHGLLLTGQRSGVGSNAVARFFQTQPGAKLDLLKPVKVILRATRGPGDDASAQPTHAEFSPVFSIPNAAAYAPVRETPQWLKIWAQRWLDLAVMAGGVVLLAVALARQAWLSARPRRLASFRIAYLLFTLVFIGWVAQGQLTIVNLTSLIEALVAGRSADFLLADPMALLLWAFVGVTLLVWGRGTFCGWLCPFGAFQELLSVVTRTLGWRPRHLHTRLDASLKKIKFAAFALIAGSALLSSSWTAALVEFEPFKTTISMSFQRDWPYVAWAVLCLAASVFVFRGYCRYLCPLGAGLALLDRLRLRAWIPRRAQCGTPCQTCRHRCQYQAITPAGAIDYAECFQCLDCVAIHQDHNRCMPLIRERKGRVIALRPVVQAP